MRMAMIFLLAALLWAAPAVPGHAQGTPAAQDAEDVANVITAILEDPERLPLPLERIRPALVQHYVQDRGAIYWVGTGRMTPFLQRLADAADDGLNPADYPLDALMELRDDIEPDDAGGARAAALQRELLDAFKRSMPAVPDAHEQLDQLLGSQITLGMLTDIVAYTLDIDVDTKLRLLAECDVVERTSTLLAAIAARSQAAVRRTFPPDFSPN